jgi:hypothetical protein
MGYPTPGNPPKINNTAAKANNRLRNNPMTVKIIKQDWKTGLLDTFKRNSYTDCKPPSHLKQ